MKNKTIKTTEIKIRKGTLMTSFSFTDRKKKANKKACRGKFNY